MVAIRFCGTPYLKQMQEWFAARVGVPIHERLLSFQGVAVLGADEEPIAIAYLYPSVGSEICWLGFVATSPDLTPFGAQEALVLLFVAAETYAKELGYNIVYTGHDSRGLHKIAEGLGYHKGSAVVEYFKELV